MEGLEAFWCQNVFCKGGFLYAPPVAVFIEINWQTLDVVARKREKKGAGRTQQRLPQQVLQQQHL